MRIYLSEDEVRILAQQTKLTLDMLSIPGIMHRADRKSANIQGELIESLTRLHKKLQDKLQ